MARMVRIPGVANEKKEKKRPKRSAWPHPLSWSGFLLVRWGPDALWRSNRQKGYAYVSRAPGARVVAFDHLVHERRKKDGKHLWTVDHLVRRSMKNAANCVKYGELQGFMKPLLVERILRLWPTGQGHVRLRVDMICPAAR